MNTLNNSRVLATADMIWTKTHIPPGDFWILRYADWYNIDRLKTIGCITTSPLTGEFLLPVFPNDHVGYLNAESFTYTGNVENTSDGTLEEQWEYILPIVDKVGRRVAYRIYKAI